MCTRISESCACTTSDQHQLPSTQCKLFSEILKFVKCSNVAIRVFVFIGLTNLFLKRKIIFQLSCSLYSIYIYEYYNLQFTLLLIRKGIVYLVCSYRADAFNKTYAVVFKCIFVVYISISIVHLL